MADLTTIADAVAAELNGATLSESFTAVRVYVPTFDLPQLTTLKVAVFPMEVSISKVSRQASEDDYTIGIAIQKRVDPDVNAEVDAIVTLAEQIVALFKQLRLEDAPTASWVGAEIEPVYDPQALQEHRIATSVVSLTYRMHNA